MTNMPDYQELYLQESDPALRILPSAGVQAEKSAAAE